MNQSPTSYSTGCADHALTANPSTLGQIVSAKSSSKPVKVLVADDDAIARVWLAGLLTSWGYEVLTARDGTEALAAILQKDGPALAIVDWMMPGADGPEICQQVRQSSVSEYTYIVLLTSKDQQSDVVEGLHSGADDYLKKPFDPIELRARLEVGLRICAQKALRDSEIRFRAAFASAGVAMTITDPSGRFLQVNQASCSLLGYHEAELLTKTFYDVTHPADLPATHDAVARLFANGSEAQRLEKRYVHKTGACVWALATVSFVRHDDGRPAYLVTQMEDITQRKNMEQALQSSEALFRAITENANELILVVRPDHVILYASPAYESLLGYAPQDLCDSSALATLVYPDDHAMVQQKSQDLLQSGKVEPVQVRLRHKDGSFRTVESHAGAIRNQQGQVERFVITSRLIDDRLAAEQVLREREEQLQLLLDSTAEAIYGIDMQGNCTFCNNAFLRMTGHETMDEMLGQNMHRLIHHHLADGSPYQVEDCRIYQALSKGEGSHVDDEVLWRADGSCFPAEYWSYPVFKGGEIDGCVVTFVDISKRRQTQDALRNAHSESELFINSVPSILIGLDKDLRITRWNLAAMNTFGLSKEDVQGQKLAECGIRWLHKGIHDEISSWQHVENPHRCDSIPFEKDGQTRVLAITVSRVSVSSDETLGLLITGADVTDRKTLESQLRQAQKLEAIGQLAAGIAHEINTPIQYVGDNTEFIKDSWNAATKLFSACQEIRAQADQPDQLKTKIAEFEKSWEEADVDYLQSEVPRAIDQTLDGVQRVAKIVRAMKEFSHPGSEDKKPLDINRAIETTITVARNEWKYVADVETSLDEALPMVPCLAGEFNQAILNMIINAAHAIADVVKNNPGTKGTIHISTNTDGDWAEVQIRDTGSGIPEEIRLRIFEPFFTTKEVGKGTGQGLTLAHSVIVNKHGGQLWLESEVGKGTTFFIRLPLGATVAKEEHVQADLVRR